MVAAFWEFPVAREGKPQGASTFQASACLMFANILFSETSPVAKTAIDVGEGIEMYKDIETGVIR